MNILVTGANGQLGQCFRKLINERGNGEPNHNCGDKNYYIFAGSDELDITNENAVNEYIKKNFINVVINCAAYTDVDKAEEDWDKAFEVNVNGAKNLAKACASIGAVLIHISTDYVFDGKWEGEYTPDNEKNPQTAYGLTKSRGEEAIKLFGFKYIIIRTSWLYSEYGKNFVKTINEKLNNGDNIKVVDDQVGSATYAMDLADFILHIIEGNNAKTRYLSKSDIWHFANKGTLSWYDLAKAVENLKENCKGSVSPCKTEEFPRPAKRPEYSVLNTKRTEKDFDYNIRPWFIALADCLEKLNK